MTEPVFKISNSLRTAYSGLYFEELEAEIMRPNVAPGHLSEAKKIGYLTDLRIINDSPGQRLAVYLEWHGIIGYTETIYSIAIGRLA